MGLGVQIPHPRGIQKLIPHPHGGGDPIPHGVPMGGGGGAQTLFSPFYLKFIRDLIVSRNWGQIFNTCQSSPVHSIPFLTSQISIAKS